MSLPSHTISPTPPTLESNQATQSLETSLSTGLPTKNERADGATKVPDQRLCEELITIYFDLLHDKQHARFHTPTLIAEQRLGKAPAFLILELWQLQLGL